MLSTASPRRVFAYMEGFVTCAAFAALQAVGRLDDLAAQGVRPADLGSDRFLAAAVLHYLAQRGVLRRDAEGEGEDGIYRLTELGHELYDDRSYLIWLSGGYGDPLHQLGALLTGERRFGVDVDRDMRWVAVGTALAGQKDLLPEVHKLLGEIDFTRVADVGCGHAHLLLSLCEDGRRTGIGIDVSAAACAEAEAGVRAAETGDRVTIVEADAKDLATVPGLEDVDLVLAFFFLHEVLEDGEDALVAWLRSLGQRLPAGAWVLTAEVTPSTQPRSTAEPFTPEYVLTQALMHQTIVDAAHWRRAFAAGGFDVCRIVQTDLPGTFLILARTPEA